MHRLIFALALTGLALTGGRAGAQETGLDWMTGTWRSQGDDPVIMESWSDMAGGLMLGFNRTLVNGEAVAFELLRIESDADGVRYCAQPGGRPATCFTQVSRDWQEVRFENPDHDFPQVIEYWRSGDRLTARIADLSGDTEMLFHWDAAGD